MNPPYSIVFLDRGTLPVALRAPALPLQWQEHEATPPEQVVECLANAEVAISNKVPLMAAQLAQLPRLKLIAVAATGTNNVDLDHCRAHGIAVCNVSGYSTDSVAEHVFALLLALRRQVHSYHADILAGGWQRSAHFALLNHPLTDLHGSTLGIFGYGHIGQAVARIAEAFGMRVLVAEHRNATAIRAGRVPFDEMLEQADAVTLHCPLTPETRHLIAGPELRRMKPGAILLNLARGGVVDEAALALALRENRIAGQGWTCSPPSRRARATRCWKWPGRTASSRPMSPGPASNRWRASPKRSCSTSRRFTQASCATGSCRAWQPIDPHPVIWQLSTLSLVSPALAQ